MGPDVRGRLSEADKASTEAGHTSLRRARRRGLTQPFRGCPFFWAFSHGSVCSGHSWEKRAENSSLQGGSALGPAPIFQLCLPSWSLWQHLYPHPAHVLLHQEHPKTSRVFVHTLSLVSWNLLWYFLETDENGDREASITFAVS